MSENDVIVDSVALGRKVSDLRHAQGITQTQLAGLANTGVRFISDLENGKETCQIGKIQRVLAVLGASVLLCFPYEKD